MIRIKKQDGTYVDGYVEGADYFPKEIRDKYFPETEDSDAEENAAADDTIADSRDSCVYVMDDSRWNSFIRETVRSTTEEGNQQPEDSEKTGKVSDGTERE